MKEFMNNNAEFIGDARRRGAILRAKTERIRLTTKFYVDCARFFEEWAVEREDYEDAVKWRDLGKWVKTGVRG